MKPNQITNYLLIISLAILIFGLGFKMGEQHKNNPTASLFGAFQESTPVKNVDFTLFWDTWNQLQDKYVDKSKLDSKKMLFGAIKGMVASVDDPYTFFVTPDENKSIKDDLGGRFEGIGAQLGVKDGHIIVIAPLKNSPAEKAGMQAGDIVVNVDGQSTKGWTLVQAVSKIRGDKGTKVKITVQRAQKTIDFTLVRDQIHVSSVDLSYEKRLDCAANCPQVADLKLSQFGEATNDEWDTAVSEIATKWQNKQIKGLILDLRDNPGGYLESAVYTASEFLPEGKIVVKQESTTEGSKDYYVMRTGKLKDIPIITLINKGSASAAEILSGSLHDYNRSKLVGEKSFGKGSVQDAIDLQNGAGLHVTIAKWILPNGEWINGKGIEPDIKVENNTIKEGETLTRDTDKQLETAVEQILK